MLKNYLNVTLRTLRRHKGYTAINIAGLAVGMACCLLVVLFIRDEMSFDRFHHEADQIQRVTIEAQFSGMRAYSGLNAAIMQEVYNTLPSVVRATHLNRQGRVVVQRGETLAYEEHFTLADSSFFDVFGYALQRGHPETALVRPYTLVLSPAVAEKFFGPEDPIGQTLMLNGTDRYEVTGVLAAIPKNSHLQFDMLGSFETIKASGQYNENAHIVTWQTYLVLGTGYTPDQLHTDLEAVLARHLTDRIDTWAYYVEPVPSIYLQPQTISLRTDDLRGEMRYIYIFSAIAVLILLIACVNYMNLATARAARRSREVGIRKVVGASRAQLIRQFMGESLLFCLVASLLALGLVEVMLPGFNHLVGKHLSVQTHVDGPLLLIVGGIIMMVGLGAGGYPALVLSAFRPVDVLKGRGGGGGSRRAWLRKGLVVFQFGISAFLIISTLIIQQQLRFVQNQRLGFDVEQVVLVRPKQQLKTQYQPFKQTLLQEASIRGVTMAPLPGGSAFPFRMPGEEETHYLNAFFVDYDFIDLMGIDVIEGRGFSSSVATDAEHALVVNEEALKYFEWSDPLHEKLDVYDRETGGFTSMHVIGVVRDFNTTSLRNSVRPTLLSLSETPSYGSILVKVDGQNVPEALAAIRKQWEVFEPAYPFEYDFLDDTFAAFYTAEQRLGQVFGVFSFLAIFIACLGLLGLVAYMTEQRTKEIGIRKILGASVPSIMALLSKEFLRLVVAAAVVVAPLAYVVMQRWLEDFAYRTEISWSIFLIAGLLALGIALLTVSSQAMKAAMTNPVEALRHE